MAGLGILSQSVRLFIWLSREFSFLATRFTAAQPAMLLLTQVKSLSAEGSKQAYLRLATLSYRRLSRGLDS
jgi:hypothetical protein